jgi:RNA polymerase sigma-70 factor, ECF subfamily
MRWKSTSTRSADGLLSKGKAWLYAALELRGLKLRGLEMAGTGLSVEGFALLAAKMGGSQPDAESKTPDGEKSSQETPFPAQPSGPDGVPEGMAALVLDNPALGASPAASPAERPGERGAAPGDWGQLSDAEIMLRAAAGDESAFNYLVEKYHRPILHFLFRMVRNQAIAEELAQEVFLRVYRARQSYRAEAKFTTWLYRIATNLTVNYARDHRRERAVQTVYLDAPDEETGAKPEVACDELSAEQNLLRKERMKAIQGHVMALPERQRLAVVMHKYQGLDYREIGAALKLSESATKSLLFRAYQTLRGQLKDFV